MCGNVGNNGKPEQMLTLTDFVGKTAIPEIGGLDFTKKHKTNKTRSGIATVPQGRGNLGSIGLEKSKRHKHAGYGPANLFREEGFRRL